MLWWGYIMCGGVDSHAIIMTYNIWYYSEVIW